MITEKSKKIYTFLETTGEKIIGSDESKEYNINCFLCTDKRHRLGINKETERWNCFNCFSGGKTLKTLEYAFKNRSKVKNNDTIKKTEQEVKCKIPNDFHKAFIEDLNSDEGKECFNYLIKERGLSAETIKHFELGFRWEFAGRKGYYDAGDHLVIPYIKNNKCVNIKYRKIKPESKKDKWRREEGGVSALYNDAVIDNFEYSEIIIAEAEIDAMSIYEMGFKNVISLTTGAGGFKNKPEWIDRLERFEKIYLVLDRDDAGQEGARNLATMLGLGRCLNVTLPEDVKDPNDFLLNKKYKPKDFIDLLAHGVMYDVRNATTLTQQNKIFYHEKFVSKEREKASKYDTPWPTVNRIIGPLNGGYLFVLGGKPKCFMYNSTLIDGNTGHRITIEDAFKNKTSSTYSLNESTNKINKEEITDWIDSGVKDCFEIETAIGRKISLTGCHPLLKFNGWTKVKDLKVGDYIAVPTKYGVFGNLSWDTRKTHLVASLIADGSTLGSTPMYYKDDKELVRIINDASGYFDGLSMNKRNEDYTYSFTYKGLGNPLNSLIKELGLKTLSKDKVLPDDVFEFDKETLSNFIGMLWSHDGSIFLKGNKTSIEYCSASETLIDQLVTLLLKFGISFRKRSRTVKLKGKEFKSYTIGSTRTQTVKLFLDNMPLFGDKCDIKRVFSESFDRDYLTSFPKEVWRLLRLEALNSGISWSEVKKQYWEGKYKKTPNFKENGNCSVSTIVKINKIIKSKEIDKLINGDVGYSKVKSITPLGKQQCYDVTVPSHSNLIVNDIVSHNCGKTTIAMEMMKHWGRKKINCGIYSCEMRASRLQEKWLLSEPHTLPSREGKAIDYITPLDYHRACLRLPSNKMHIFCPTIQNDIVIDGVVENVEALVKRYGLKVVVVDNLHYLCRGDDENALVSEATQKLKLLAERLDILIVLIVHPKKTNTNKQLKPEDLKGSSSIIQDADVIWLQHRPFQNDDMKEDEVKTGYAKHNPITFKTDIDVTGRFTEGGKTFLYFSGAYSTFKCEGVGYNSIVDDFGKSSKGSSKRKKRAGL